MNCAHCAMALNHILSNGLPIGGKDAIKAVSIKKIDLSTQFSFSKSTDPRKSIDKILRSFVDDDRIVKCVETYIDPVSFDIASDKIFIVLDKDLSSKKRSIKLKRSNFQNIKATLQDLAIPGRNGVSGKSEFYLQQNVSYGFIILTRLEDESEGHILNWFRDSENQIYFLDAQDHKNPNSFVQEKLPQEGFRDEVFFITCTPPEGFNIKVKTMPKDEQEQKIKMEMRGDEDLKIESEQGMKKGQKPQTMQTAQSGNAKEKYNLGECFLVGDGVPKDEKQGFKCFLEADQMGDAEATNMLGLCYEKGIGVNIDYAKSLEYLQKSVLMGNVRAIFNIGWHYEWGLGISKNLTLALQCYDKSAKLGLQQATQKVKWLHILLKNKGEIPPSLSWMEYNPSTFVETTESKKAKETRELEESKEQREASLMQLVLSLSSSSSASEDNDVEMMPALEHAEDPATIPEMAMLPVPVQSQLLPGLQNGFDLSRKRKEPSLPADQPNGKNSPDNNGRKAKKRKM